MVDKSKAYEITEGLIINQENGGDITEGPFYTGGPTSPVGQDLPYNTFYIQTQASGKVLIWQKVGATANDWRQLSAQDVLFDPSGVVGNSPDLTGVTQLQAAVATLANRNFGKEYAYADNGIFTTTSATYVDALSFSGTFPGGTYRIAYSYGVTNSKENTNCEVRVFFDGVEYDPRIQLGLTDNRVTGFEGNITFAGGTLNASIQVRRTAGNGNAIITNPKGELWRLT